MRVARRVVSLLVLPVALACLFAAPVGASEPVGGPGLAGRGYAWDRGASHPPRIVASSYVIADATTGQVLAAKDPHGLYRPASTLKVLTSITLIPRLDPAQVVRPSHNAVNASGSAVGLDTRWKYAVRDLFSGLLMQSGNDAAIALAEANGGLPATLDAMNAEARRIQAYDTVARTPNGLDDDPPLTLKQQHSSAYDLALMMKQGLTLPDFRRYVGQVRYDFPAPPTKKQRAKGKKTGGYQIGTHDHLLLGDRYPGMIGGKNGYTSRAMASFAGAASRDGHTIVISLMHAQGDFWGDARRLLNWGFANTGKVKPVGTLVSPVPPKPVKKKQAHAPNAISAPSRTTSDGLPTWAYAVGSVAALIFVVGAALALRRRTVAASAGAAVGAPPGGHVRTVTPPEPYQGDPESTGERLWRPADTVPNPVQSHGDVKVAGSPLRPAAPEPDGAGARPPGEADRGVSWPVAPGERTVAEPSDEAEQTRVHAADPAEQTVVERPDEAEETIVEPAERGAGEAVAEPPGKDEETVVVRRRPGRERPPDRADRADDDGDGDGDGDGRTVTFERPPKPGDDS